MQVGYHYAPIGAFLDAEEAAILGTLVQHRVFALEHQQRGTWIGQIRLLKPVLSELAGGHILTVWFRRQSLSRKVTLTFIFFRAIPSSAAPVWPGASSRMEIAALRHWRKGRTDG